MRLGDLQICPRESAKPPRFPFSFTYGGRSSDELLPEWKRDTVTKRLDSRRTQITQIWSDPETGLKVYWEIIRYSDFDALDWVLYFKNTGDKDTPIIEDVQALNLVLNSPLSAAEPYRLYKTNGDPYLTEPLARAPQDLVRD